MKKSQIAVLIGGVLLLGFILVGTSLGERIFSHLAPQSQTAIQNTVTYFCREGVVRATYMDRKVCIVLPNGRKFVLPQAIAASGTRFSNGRIEFWSKGANAFVTENKKVIYSDGVAGTVRLINQNTVAFTDSMKTFSFQFPKQFRVSGKGIGFTTDWRAGTTDLGMVLAFVTIPKSYLPQTNFSGATFTIGESSSPEAIKNCFDKPQGYGTRMEQVVIHGISFTKFTFSDAGAGNLYETVSYRTKRGEECYVIEYTVHSTNIGMYSPDQGIKEFDRANIFNMLEKMARSFRFLRPAR